MSVEVAALRRPYLETKNDSNLERFRRSEIWRVFISCCGSSFLILYIVLAGKLNRRQEKREVQGCEGVQKLRLELEQLREQKRVSFHDLDRLIRRIVRQYESLFPNFGTNSKGSRVVYHFGVEELYPISIEREHKGRDFMLPYYAKLALNHIEKILDYVEQHL